MAGGLTNVEAGRYGLVQAGMRCTACARRTPVGLLCVDGYRWRTGGIGEWSVVESHGLLVAVQAVSVPARYVWQRTCPWVHDVVSDGGDRALRNTCGHCRAQLGDEQIAAPDGPLLGAGPASIGKPGVAWFEGPLSAAARVLPVPAGIPAG